MTTHVTNKSRYHYKKTEIVNGHFGNDEKLCMVNVTVSPSKCTRPGDDVMNKGINKYKLLKISSKIRNRY